MQLGVKRLHPEVELPTYSTSLSACADIRAFFKHVEHVQSFTEDNSSVRHPASDSISVAPGWRAMIPTGLVLDIPEGHSCRIHPRSGLSLKEGLGLICSEGVADEDYQKELFILVVNLSSKSKTISCGDRIAQIELVKDLRAPFVLVDELSHKDSTRDGGFGHTGTR